MKFLLFCALSVLFISKADASCSRLDFLGEWHQPFKPSAEANTRETYNWVLSSDQLRTIHTLSDLFGPYEQVETTYSATLDRSTCTLTLTGIYERVKSWHGFQAPHTLSSDQTHAFRSGEKNVTYSVSDAHFPAMDLSDQGVSSFSLQPGFADSL